MANRYKLKVGLSISIFSIDMDLLWCLLSAFPRQHCQGAAYLLLYIQAASLLKRSKCNACERAVIFYFYLHHVHCIWANGDLYTLINPVLGISDKWQ